ncbi:hypothetical protein HDZ31DRAFT_74318 [Schizophyllum fasciatum]
MTSPSDPVTFYGFTPVPRDPGLLFKDHPTAGGASPKQDLFTAADFPAPESPVVDAIEAFVKAELDQNTYNHSRRVFVYGSALARTHFPTWSLDPATYYLACLLHDLGTAPHILRTTRLSFEFAGAILARERLLAHGAPAEQADSVAEAVIRHQDIFVAGGNITTLGQVLQLATILDNVGLRATLLHPQLIESTTTAFPRNGWSEHFARTIETELSLKPWCHTSTFEAPGWKEGIQSNFARDVRGNEVMKPYDAL